MSRIPIRLITAVLVVTAFALAACGDDDDTDSAVGTESAPRTVDIDMMDIEFSPDEVNVQAGETVRFVFQNKGAIAHDAFLGDEAAQEEHEMEMREMGGMGDDEMAHDEEEGSITVEPGETGEFTHTFAEGEDVLIGCHQEGHYAAGMTIAIDAG